MKECQRNCHYGNWHYFVPCCAECGKLYTDLSDMKVKPIENQLKLLNEIRAEWNAGKGMTLDEAKKKNERSQHHERN